MPRSFYWGAVSVDYSTGVRADISVQHYSVFPRYWYFEARFRCDDCDGEFLWSAEEQRVWFETCRFYVDSIPRQCRDCRAKRRDLLALRREYDEIVNAARSRGNTDQKQRVIEIIDELESGLSSVPEQLLKTRDTFRRQLSRAES